MTKFLDKPVPDVPTPKTFRGWATLIAVPVAAVGLMTWGILYLSDLSVDSQEKQEATVTQFMADYAQDGFNFDHGRVNGSMWGNVTLNISDGRGVHSCRNISMDTLRDRAPIHCADGAVIRAK